MSNKSESDYDALAMPSASEQHQSTELRTIYEISKLLGSSLDLSKTCSLLSCQTDTQ